jgi:HAD superfamily hydrolase (TIGR01662 family)
MLLPHRHLSDLAEPLDLPAMPEGVEWNGEIAYLDRDGVLNVGSEDYINEVRELVVYPDAGNSVGDIRRAGFRICIVTNQSPIGRGLWGHKVLASVNSALQKALLIQDEDAHLDLILYSPYAPWEGAWSRKGRPGMLQVGRQLLDAAREGSGVAEFDYGPDYSARDERRSFMVGDRRADVEAGVAHGVRMFRCEARIGLSDVLSRVLDDSNSGDY